MKFKRTIIFLSPIPWLFHNRQIALFARSLSKSFNVVYIDCSSMGNNSVSFLELLDFRKLANYLDFYKNLKSSRKLVTRPLIVTLKKYKSKEGLGKLDGYLFLYQIKKIAKLASRHDGQGLSKTLIWTSTLQFDDFWKKVERVSWVFDFFDRYPIHSDAIAETERWLLRKSEAVFVNSTFYKKLSEKTLKRSDKIITTPVGYYLSPYLKVKPKKNDKEIVIGYGGGLSDRLDFSLIIDSIRLNPDIKFVFAGPVYEKAFHTVYKPYSTSEFVEKLKKFKNVKILPTQRGPKGIRRVMSGFDIGWIPYNTKVPFNMYSTPTKFYEYCAFGIPTISTRIETMKEYRSLIYFLTSPKKLKDLISEVASKNSEALIKKRKKFALLNDISGKYKVVKKVLNKI